MLPEGLAKEQREAEGIAHAQAGGGFEDVRGFWRDGYAAALQDSEWEGDDGLLRGEGGGVGDCFDFIWLPAEFADWRIEADGAFVFCDALRQIGGELVVAVAQAVAAITLDGFFGLLLCAQGGCADLAMVCGVEAFNVADGGIAIFGGDGFAVEIFGEGEVGAGEVFEFFERVEEVGEFVGAGVEAGVVEADLCAVALVGFEAGFFDECP